MEVLSILETQGLSGDFSEVIDSCSDLEEIPCQEKGSHDDHQHAVKEDNSSNTSRPDTSEVDDAHSESESQISPTENRSKILSWKGVNRHAPLVTNGDKKIDHNRQRQRRSFLSAADSFPRHHLGKSCRKIKRKEMGCVLVSFFTSMLLPLYICLMSYSLVVYSYSLWCLFFRYSQMCSRKWEEQIR